ncbi:Beta-glucan synthesis-associated [Mycena venus]|uniref:Beta-glucan synthesis-associated n=1 Tax=Mycena venus TaxID=2733690 RepID=A0A8H7D211_9AGAR|nr:Beta-glucan synthesis-associated [Mycena venus]
MKLFSSFSVLASLISVLPTSHALIGADWSVTKVPLRGLNDITFPLTIVEADHISGYYFAQQFNFFGIADVGYTGLQPRPDNGGKSIVHGVFSSFVAGTTTTDPNCHTGADGGPGVSCAFEWNGEYNRTYDLEVKTSGNRLWVGTAVDTVAGTRIHIGSWTLPAGTGGILGSQVGFVEWYPWNNGEPQNHCAHLPYQKTIFGNPKTTNPGSVGTQHLAYEYGDCLGQVAFSTGKVASGMVNNCGFRGQTGR